MKNKEVIILYIRSPPAIITSTAKITNKIIVFLFFIQKTIPSYIKEVYCPSSSRVIPNLFNTISSFFLIITLSSSFM